MLNIFAFSPESLLLRASKTAKVGADSNSISVVQDPYDVRDAIQDKFEAPNIRYKCRHADCELTFKRRNQLHSHEFTHTQKRNFLCPEPDCINTYINDAHLQRHIRVVHSNKSLEEVPCKFGPPCTRRYKSKEKMLLHYQKVHVDKTDIKSLSFRCELCAEVFRRKAQHRQHMFSHTNEYPYTCQHCKRGFMNRYNFVRHENSHRIYNCTECDAKFLKWSLLVAHRNDNHKTAETICDICQRKFQSKRGLKHHRAVHEEKADREVLQCPYDKCPSFFFHQRNLNAHIRGKHEGRTFICDIGGCGKTLCTKQKLLFHMKVVHLDPKSPSPKSKSGPRKRRRDKGVPKQSTASRLAMVHAPKEFDSLVLAGKGQDIQFEYNSSTLDDISSLASVIDAELIDLSL